MEPPHLDRSIGIEIYATGYEGIGGRIRARLDDFVVEEILDETVLRHLSTRPQRANTYRLYGMVKRGLDTIHAVNIVERRLGLKANYLGIKDARALTMQHISIPDRGVCDEARISGRIEVRMMGYLPYPLNSSHLLGNRFKIKVRGAALEKCRHLAQIGEEALNMRIPNFFGYQRFGSRRPVSHLVGGALVRRGFTEAVDLLLSYTTSEEQPSIREARRRLGEDSLNIDVEDLPYTMDLERLLLAAYKRYRGDPIRALRAIPLRLRRILVEAYQSYLFNKTLSAALKDGLELDTIRASDIYAEVSGLRLGDERRASARSAGVKNRVVLLCPLVGYSFREDRYGRLGAYAAKILADEGMTPRGFYIDEMPEVSVRGGIRPASLLVGKISFSLDDCLIVEADLGKGCYITTLLREVMKPQDPIGAGF